MKPRDLPAWLKDNEIRAIYSLLERLKRRLDVQELRIFGSKARGDFDNDSDIDLMIMVPTKTREMAQLIDQDVFETNLEFEAAISTILFSREEIECGPMSESPLYKRIVAEGVPIDIRRKTA
jgi:uncharacterized protein